MLLQFKSFVLYVRRNGVAVVPLACERGRSTILLFTVRPCQFWPNTVLVDVHVGKMKGGFALTLFDQGPVVQTNDAVS